ncbi:hypothetical protein PTTG_27517 [Puccinia triticina 1-1 BBBD Race 1]|uniref:Uncharacterized protein n=1 Tax=Puccinia triticina (isolate 1-1 / race 1 (BBBD)) TaxID=630390 RepID=A0A180GJV5_PUCT1|nr:hypothetical protein PTTG_27517 [Puccinia triticina 1-1 BBBD Race 1]
MSTPVPPALTLHKQPPQAITPPPFRIRSIYIQLGPVRLARVAACRRQQQRLDWRLARVGEPRKLTFDSAQQQEQQQKQQKM